MSKVSLFKKININESVNIEKSIGKSQKINPLDKNQKYEKSDQNFIVLTDHHGNIFFKHDDTYYLLFLDSTTPEGAYLIKVKNIEFFRNIYRDSHYSESTFFSGGQVRASGETLKGKALADINVLDEEKKEEFFETHEYSIPSHDNNESNYYWVKREKREDTEDEDEENLTPDNSFYLDSVSKSETDGVGLVLADLLCEYPCSFKTILIDGGENSHNIISVVQQKNEFSCQEVTIYTSGVIKTNFADKEKVCLLYVDDSNIIHTGAFIVI